MKADRQFFVRGGRALAARGQGLKLGLFVGGVGFFSYQLGCGGEKKGLFLFLIGPDCHGFLKFQLSQPFTIKPRHLIPPNEMSLLSKKRPFLPSHLFTPLKTIAT